MNAEFYSKVNVVKNAGYTGNGKSLGIVTANETFNSECSSKSCGSRILGEWIYLRDVTQKALSPPLSLSVCHTLSDPG